MGNLFSLGIKELELLAKSGPSYCNSIAAVIDKLLEDSQEKLLSANCVNRDYTAGVVAGLTEFKNCVMEARTEYEEAVRRQNSSSYKKWS